MKKKISILGAVVALVSVLALPGAVIADNTTVVTGNVIAVTIFTPPSAVELGDMEPSDEPHRAHSADGSLKGNHPLGYTVTGTDENQDSMTTGYMWVGGTASDPENKLNEKLWISNQDAEYVYADSGKFFLITSGETDAGIALYVEQLVTYEDPVAAGYSITIKFTMTPNT